jgi:hypothetical protein
VDTYTWETFTTQDYSTGTVVTDGSTTVEGSGTTWSTNVAADDVMLIDIDNDGVYEFESEVASVTDNDTLVLDDAAPTSSSGARNYRIIKPARSWNGSELGSYPTWDAIRGSNTTIRDFYIGKYDILYKLDIDGADDDGSAIAVQLTTRDIDFDLPDEDKFYGSLSLKLEDYAPEEISFTVLGSVDRGQTEKSLGTLTVPADRDEAKITFRLTGSIARFRLVSTSNVAVYTINEIVIRARVRGREVPGRSDIG